MFQFIRKENEKKKKENVAQRMKPQRENRTGIPAQLKDRIEGGTGISLDDVRVHYNSDRPAKLDALAYTRGSQVEIAPGQEQHLAHELGHVVQQKLGAVRANARHASGVAMNTDPVLERQADEIGAGKEIVQRMGENVVQRCPPGYNDEEEDDDFFYKCTVGYFPDDSQNQKIDWDERLGEIDLNDMYVDMMDNVGIQGSGREKEEPGFFFEEELPDFGFEQQETTNNFGGQQTIRGPYSHIKDDVEVGPGRDFTATQKEKIIACNKGRNNEEVISDVLDDEYRKLVKPKKSMKGVTPPPNEWQIDHIWPKDKGGTNSYSNAQVVSRAYNRAKWNH